nr:hypothetical protein Iba_chr09aCG0910 [Ipomoea batatas]GMD36545.1 hypothetical protein Iba_chr09eCG0970 [Ipomoea batatas]GME12124.1 hypothetical protein Iba_scaffold13375CG0020 [Ipomoea batatas]
MILVISSRMVSFKLGWVSDDDVYKLRNPRWTMGSQFLGAMSSGKHVKVARKFSSHSGGVAVPRLAALSAATRHLDEAAFPSVVQDFVFFKVAGAWLETLDAWNDYWPPRSTYWEMPRRPINLLTDRHDLD